MRFQNIQICAYLLEISSIIFFLVKVFGECYPEEVASDFEKFEQFPKDLRQEWNYLVHHYYSNYYDNNTVIFFDFIFKTFKNILKLYFWFPQRVIDNFTECLKIGDEQRFSEIFYLIAHPFSYIEEYKNVFCESPNKTLSCFNNYLNNFVRSCGFNDSTLNHPDKLIPLQKMLDLFCDKDAKQFSMYCYFLIRIMKN